MVYWERCTDDGTLPITIKALARVLGETGWHRTTRYYGASGCLSNQHSRTRAHVTRARRRRGGGSPISWRQRRLPSRERTNGRGGGR